MIFEIVKNNIEDITDGLCIIRVENGQDTPMLRGISKEETKDATENIRLKVEAYLTQLYAVIDGHYPDRGEDQGEVERDIEAAGVAGRGAQEHGGDPHALAEPEPDPAVRAAGGGDAEAGALRHQLHRQEDRQGHRRREDAVRVPLLHQEQGRLRGLGGAQEVGGEAVRLHLQQEAGVHGQVQQGQAPLLPAAQPHEEVRDQGGARLLQVRARPQRDQHAHPGLGDGVHRDQGELHQPLQGAPRPARQGEGRPRGPAQQAREHQEQPLALQGGPRRLRRAARARPDLRQGRPQHLRGAQGARGGALPDRGHGRRRRHGRQRVLDLGLVQEDQGAEGDHGPEGLQVRGGPGGRRSRLPRPLLLLHREAQGLQGVLQEQDAHPAHAAHQPDQGPDGQTRRQLEAPQVLPQAYQLRLLYRAHGQAPDGPHSDIQVLRTHLQSHQTDP